MGCHEDPERTPPNRFVKALSSPAPQLTLPVALRRTVDYRHDVAPIVAARCVACHGQGGKPPDLRAGPGAPEGGAAGRTPDPAYTALLERFVQPGRARASRLVWHLFGRNTSRPWDPEWASQEVRAMRKGRPTLTDEERRTFVEWIDMGAAWDAKPMVSNADRAASPAVRPESGASAPRGLSATSAAAAPAAAGGR